MKKMESLELKPKKLDSIFKPINCNTVNDLLKDDILN
jgi:hypothetical protein